MKGSVEGKGRRARMHIRHLHQKPIPLNMPEPSINFFSIMLRRQGRLSLISFPLPLFLYQCYLPCPLLPSYFSIRLPRNNTFSFNSLRCLKIFHNRLPMLFDLLALPALPPCFLDYINTTNLNTMSHLVF